MQLFYTTDIRGDHAHLSEEEARHCVQVLRHKVGDQLSFVDGMGNWYEGTIVETGRKKCVLSIQSTKSSYKERSCRLHIAIAPTKSMDRYEWFLEKATEIGVDEITPLLCQNAERKKIRMDRLERVLISAMKQSLRAKLPSLNAFTKFDDFVNRSAESEYQKMIAHCATPLEPMKKIYTPGNDVILLIGPEGDFSPSEIDRVDALGYQGVSLGNHRLRTETAGLVGVQYFNFIN